MASTMTPQKTAIKADIAAETVDIDLLIVDDEAVFREMSVRYFKKLGFRVEEAEDGEEALNIVTNRSFDVVVLDIHMPGMNGLAVLGRLMELDPKPQVIMLTGGGTIQNAVESIKKGAYDFLTKPVKLDDLERVIRRACQTQKLEQENRQLKEMIKRQASCGEIVGKSPVMLELFRLIQKTSSSGKAILIEGESGTGKELVAKAIHQSSPLADKPFLTINCAALPESLLESELFGHEKGSFTGAIATKPGLFEVADGGTLFIDEFGEMSGAMQSKLLRVLEDGSMRRVGSTTERHVQVRLIAATNRNLEQDVKDGKFREDLYYRINVLGLKLPPLRQRSGDIELLARKFAGEDWAIDEEVIRCFNRYSWPGNVRQLQNAIDRAKVLGDDCRIELKNLPEAIVEASSDCPQEIICGEGDLEHLIGHHIEESYLRCGKNKTKTAKALGVNRRSLYRLLEKHNIS